MPDEVGNQSEKENFQKMYFEEIDISFKDNISGLLFWTLLDWPIGSIPDMPYDDHEYNLGVFRRDYSPKPVVSSIREYYKRFLTSIY